MLFAAYQLFAWHLLAGTKRESLLSALHSLMKSLTSLRRGALLGLPGSNVLACLWESQLSPLLLRG
jgi:hypothetical protein